MKEPKWLKNKKSVKNCKSGLTFLTLSPWPLGHVYSFNALTIVSQKSAERVKMMTCLHVNKPIHVIFSKFPNFNHCIVTLSSKATIMTMDHDYGSSLTSENRQDNTVSTVSSYLSFCVLLLERILLVQSKVYLKSFTKSCIIFKVQALSNSETVENSGEREEEGAYPSMIVVEQRVEVLIGQRPLSTCIVLRVMWSSFREIWLKFQSNKQHNKAHCIQHTTIYHRTHFFTTSSIYGLYCTNIQLSISKSTTCITLYSHYKCSTLQGGVQPHWLTEISEEVWITWLGISEGYL